MKQLKIFISSIILFVSIFLLTACGSMNIDYDLSKSGNTITYSTVINMKKTPKNYINKTFKIRGKVKNNGKSYHYLFGTDAENCCNWELEVRTQNAEIEYPSSSKNVIAVGTYKSSKVNGRTSYYLEISDFE